jgi:hypothetical protein
VTSRVDPQDAMTPEAAFDVWFDPDYFTEDAEGDQRHGFLAGWVAARSAVVRPTRDQEIVLRETIEHAMTIADGCVAVTDERPSDTWRVAFRFDILDALLAAFWPGTPEAPQ